jgi:hypothetical protein
MDFIFVRSLIHDLNRLIAKTRIESIRRSYLVFMFNIEYVLVECIILWPKGTHVLNIIVNKTFKTHLCSKLKT